ncbi:molybdate transport system ATP-binding protein/molybdate transport system permease protein [Caloramator quimbayensis]|uniref:Molybdate transport system ATP-binding protein/molybdate transport system permease protein n=1 Tax=Caloramator quimbayensis TaxID=1147123 RepID=A0A1T4Y782_9CLOT|nr:ABC transporter ATP-binding protein [Caloramator quimbayensis]SKA97657.1 molybdate transport system ATP-binding protein/molybdate transport system permease protein [Caloramator quimbayensis]
MLEVSFEKKFGSFALKSSFCCDKEVLGILGPSGCGKSLTLKCIAGLFPPDRGIIKLDGREFFNSEKKINIPSRNRNIGFVFQNYALFPHLTVYDNIAYGIKDLDKSKRHEKVMDFIKKMQLTGCEKKYPSQLSGGQQQRTALARTLIKEPSLLLLDEPFSAIDTHVKSMLKAELLEIIKKYQGTVLFITHDIEEAYEMCDKILIMNGGQCIQRGDKRDVIKSPVNLDSARITGCKNFFDVDIVGERKGYNLLQHNGLLIYANKNNKTLKEKMTAGIRQHDIKLLKEAEGDMNTFECEIVDVIEGISYSTVFLRCKDLLLQAEISNFKYSEYENGKAFFYISPEDIFVVSKE